MRRAYKIALAVGAALVSAILLAGTAYAGHGSRDGVLGESRTDVVFIVLMGAVSMLAAFARFTLWRERQDL